MPRPRRRNGELSMEMPAFIEVEPDSYKPFDKCSTEELLWHAETLMGQALMKANEAREMAERVGDLPISAELMEKSRDHMALSNAILDHLSGKYGPAALE